MPFYNGRYEVSDSILRALGQRGQAWAWYCTVQFSAIQCLHHGSAQTTPACLGGVQRRRTLHTVLECMLVRLHPRPVGSGEHACLLGLLFTSTSGGLFHRCLIVYFRLLCGCFDRPVPGSWGFVSRSALCQYALRFPIDIPSSCLLISTPSVTFH